MISFNNSILTDPSSYHQNSREGLALNFIFSKKVFKFSAAVLAVLLLLPFSAQAAAKKTGADFKVETGRVLVIDPGHGGEDGGAVSITGALECDLNLDIAKKLDTIIGLFGVPVVMTRETADIKYPDDAKTVKARKNSDIRRRIEIVNNIENPVLISVHQNNYPAKQPFGAQVFYSETEESKKLAEFTQNILKTVLNPLNKRPAVEVSDSIILMKQAKCTGILIECGFLSNPEENALLQTDTYKLKLAWAIAAAYLGFYGGTNEG